jgi:hypothetical protein
MILDMPLAEHTHALYLLPKSLHDAINRYYPLEGTKEMIAELEEEQEGIEEAVELVISKKKILWQQQVKAPYHQTR